MNIREILLTFDQIKAIDNADNPSGSNPFITSETIEYHYSSSNGLTKTTSDDFVDKLSFQIEIGSGLEKDFIIEWVFKVLNTVGNAVAIRLLLNDVEIASDYCYISGGSNSNFRLKSGFLKETCEGTCNFKIQFKRDIGGEAKIKQVKLLLRRVN